MTISMPGALVLEDGRTFRGRGFTIAGAAYGEAVFSTGMSGYQETLTDPSYRRQIVVMTAPHIGNTGMNAEDAESRQIWVSGYVVRDLSRIASNWRSETDLASALIADGVLALTDVDTRAVTRHLRDRGAMRAGVFAGEPALMEQSELVALVQASPSMVGADLAGEVTTPHPYTVPAQGEQLFRIAALDLGIKAMTPKQMAKRGITVEVLPASTPITELAAMSVDGLFLSNGPGDPATASHATEVVRWALAQRLPVFGICFGNQILARALGLSTYKLPFGHRGINQPVMDLRTRRVEVTSQNHGFAVKAEIGEIIDTEFGRVQVSHVGLNDEVVEGIECLDRPAFSVQYHPEAASGPHDADYLFDRFRDLLKSSSRGVHA